VEKWLNKGNGRVVDWLNGKDELKTDNYLTAPGEEEKQKDGF